jgi:TatD DNase family protein
VKYFDTHCHLNHRSFQADLDAVLKRAFDSGVEYMIVPGWDLESSRHAVELAEKYPQILAAIGIHPGEVQYNPQISPDGILKLAIHPKVVAIGEIGLDYFHDNQHPMEQQSLLKEMLAIARESSKKVILHSREAMHDMIPILTTWVTELRATAHPLAGQPGVLHAFEGTFADAQQLLPFGFLFGVGGPLTYKNAQQKKDVFASIPDERILLETDAPYLSPQGHRGERNEPSFLPLVANELHFLKDESLEAMLQNIHRNSYNMFIKESLS